MNNKNEKSFTPSEVYKMILANDWEALMTAIKNKQLNESSLQPISPNTGHMIWRILCANTSDNAQKINLLDAIFDLNIVNYDYISNPIKGNTGFLQEISVLWCLAEKQFFSLIDKLIDKGTLIDKKSFNLAPKQYPTLNVIKLMTRAPKLFNKVIEQFKINPDLFFVTSEITLSDLNNFTNATEIIDPALLILARKKEWDVISQLLNKDIINKDNFFELFNTFSNSNPSNPNAIKNINNKNTFHLIFDASQWLLLSKMMIKIPAIAHHTIKMINSLPYIPIKKLVSNPEFLEFCLILKLVCQQEKVVIPDKFIPFEEKIVKEYFFSFKLMLLCFNKNVLNWNKFVLPFDVQTEIFKHLFPTLLEKGKTLFSSYLHQQKQKVTSIFTNRVFTKLTEEFRMAPPSKLQTYITCRDFLEKPFKEIINERDANPKPENVEKFTFWMKETVKEIIYNDEPIQKGIEDRKYEL